MESSERPQQMPETATGDERATSRPPDYVNADDLFYWMEDPGSADVPLCALGIDFPFGCRFCI